MVEAINYVEIDLGFFKVIEGLIASPDCVACVLSRDRQFLQKTIEELILLMRANLLQELLSENRLGELIMYCYKRMTCKKS